MTASEASDYLGLLAERDRLRESNRELLATLSAIVARADIGLHTPAPAGHRGNALRDIQKAAMRAYAKAVAAGTA